MEVSREGVPDRRYFRTPATAPGPAGPQMLGALRAIRADPLGFLQRMTREYGPIVQFPIPSPPSYLVADPEAVRRVLVERAATQQVLAALLQLHARGLDQARHRHRLL